MSPDQVQALEPVDVDEEWTTCEIYGFPHPPADKEMKRYAIHPKNDKTAPPPVLDGRDWLKSIPRSKWDKDTEAFLYFGDIPNVEGN